MNEAEVAQTTEQVKETLTRMVAKRAYEKYKDRGEKHGGDMQDWLEAEKEVTEAFDKGNLALEEAV